MQTLADKSGAPRKEQIEEAIYEEFGTRVIQLRLAPWFDKPELVDRTKRICVELPLKLAPEDIAKINEFMDFVARYLKHDFAKVVPHE